MQQEGIHYFKTNVFKHKHIIPSTHKMVHTHVKNLEFAARFI